MSRRALDRLPHPFFQATQWQTPPTFEPFDGTEAPATKTYLPTTIQHHVILMSRRATEGVPIGGKKFFWGCPSRWDGTPGRRPVGQGLGSWLPTFLPKQERREPWTQPPRRVHSAGRWAWYPHQHLALVPRCWVRYPLPIVALMKKTKVTALDINSARGVIMDFFKVLHIIFECYHPRFLPNTK